MLGKLLKYELKATARIFLPFYLFLILFSVINRLFISMNSSYLEIPKAIVFSVWIFTIAGIYVMTWIVIIQRFYKNLLSDEGYLSFTLPVKAYHHILSKAFIALMWLISNFLFCILAICIISINANTISIARDVLSTIQEAIRQTGAPTFIIVLQSIVLVVLSLLSNLLKIYTAISVGSLTNKHKILLGLGTYIGFQIVEQTLISFLLAGMGFYNDIIDPTYLFDPGTIVSFLLLSIFTSLITFTVYFFLSNWLLKNNLNLE